MKINKYKDEIQIGLQSLHQQIHIDLTYLKLVVKSWVKGIKGKKRLETCVGL